MNGVDARLTEPGAGTIGYIADWIGKAWSHPFPDHARELFRLVARANCQCNTHGFRESA